MNLPWNKLEFKEVRWPGNARIAVVLSSEYEAVRGTPVIGNGMRDFKAITEGEFEARCGVWRTLGILQKLGLKATFFINGATVEAFPESVREIHRRGHEIAGHGYEVEELWRLSEEAERKLIERVMLSIKKVTGEAPSGWKSPKAQPSENTLRILTEMGLVWDSELFDVELPYVVELGGKRILEIPRSPSTDAVRLPYTSPRDLFEAWKNEFDYLYLESEHHPRIFVINWHEYIIGRPARAKVLEDVLTYIKGHSGVWFARNIDVAEWCLNNLRC